MNVEEAPACGVNGGDYIGAGARCMSDINAAAEARVHTVHGFEYMEG
jgi:hypothetical protein